MSKKNPEPAHRKSEPKDAKKSADTTPEPATQPKVTGKQVGDTFLRDRDPNLPHDLVRGDRDPQQPAVGKKKDDDPPKPPPTLACPICGSTFGTIAALEAHLKTHENQEPDPMAETPEEKQARFDKSWAEQMARNEKAAEEAKAAAEAKKHPGKQAAANTRHGDKPKHAEKPKDGGGKRRR